MRRVVVCSSEKKQKYRVRWLEMRVAAGNVGANSPEEAVKNAVHWRALEGEETEYFGGPYANSYECVDAGAEIRESKDFNKYLARVMKPNLVKKTPSSQQ